MAIDISCNFRYYSIQEVADFMSVSKSTVYKWIKDGKLKSVYASELGVDTGRKDQLYISTEALAPFSAKWFQYHSIFKKCGRKRVRT